MTNNLPEVLRRLDSLTDWESRPRNAMRVSLDPMLDLAQRMGAPQECFRAVHVTGTKGKGSVCALIEAGLRGAGWSVGRYASPHVEHITERVTVEGEPVDDGTLARALTCALNAYEAARAANSAGCDSTWFDVLTVAAFRIFADAGVSWAVIEVGLGGRKDSTNIVFGEVAVITNVELEHTEVLGSTREAIAAEKVGILKAGATLVTTLGPDEPAGRVVHDQAERLGCPVLVVPISTAGTIETYNADIARSALAVLGQQGVLTRGPDAISVGSWLLDPTTCASIHLPGRKEHLAFRLSDDPLLTVKVVLDGAHVPFNLRAVLRDLTAEFDLLGPCVAVVALAGDKDVVGFITALCEHAARTVCTTVPTSARSISSQDVASVVAAVDPAHAYDVVVDPAQAFEKAIRWAAASGGWVLVTGSLLLVGELRSRVLHGSAPPS